MRTAERVSIARSKTQCPRSIEDDSVESCKFYLVRCITGRLLRYSIGVKILTYSGTSVSWVTHLTYGGHD